MPDKKDKITDVACKGEVAIDTKTLGAIGESAAVMHLQSEGYKIISRNTVLPGGELDIVATEGDTLAFVEVKSRLKAGLFKPRDNVTTDKTNRLKRLAKIWLKRNRKYAEKRVRYDVVEVILDGKTLSVKELTLHRAFFE